MARAFAPAGAHGHRGDHAVRLAGQQRQGGGRIGRVRRACRGCAGRAPRWGVGAQDGGVGQAAAVLQARAPRAAWRGSRARRSRQAASSARSASSASASSSGRGSSNSEAHADLRQQLAATRALRSEVDELSHRSLAVVGDDHHRPGPVQPFGQQHAHERVWQGQFGQADRLVGVAFSVASSPSGPPISSATSRPSCSQAFMRSAGCIVVSRVPRSSSTTRRTPRGSAASSRGLLRPSAVRRSCAHAPRPSRHAAPAASRAGSASRTRRRPSAPRQAGAGPPRRPATSTGSRSSGPGLLGNPGLDGRPLRRRAVFTPTTRVTPPRPADAATFFAGGLPDDHGLAHHKRLRSRSSSAPPWQAPWSGGLGRHPRRCLHRRLGRDGLLRRRLLHGRLLGCLLRPAPPAQPPSRA